MTNSNESKKVLILALSGIGNFLMQSPVFRAIKEARPDWHITIWIAPRGTRALAENNPYIDAIIEEPIKRSFARHQKLIWQLTNQKFDIGIVLSPGQLLKSAVYLFLVGIPMRLGHRYPFMGNQQSSFLLTHSIPEEPNIHDIEQNLRLLRLLDISYQLPTTNYKLDIPVSAQQKAKILFAQLQIPSNKILVGLHPGSAPDQVWKRWPVESFAEVAAELITKHNAHILIFGAPQEKELKQNLESRIWNLAHKKATTLISTDLLTTAALMQHCQLFLSNDSGLMHLAAASGVVTFGLFGPTNEKETGPRGLKSFVIRAPGTESIYNTEHSPHFGSATHSSLVVLKPREVFSRIQSLISP
jgi:heptosyltransferase-2